MPRLKLSKEQRWGAICFGAFALSMYLWFAYAGPFQWIAEFQIRTLGKYSEKVTLVLTCLALILTAGGLSEIPVIKRWLEAADEPQGYPSRWWGKLFGKDSIVPWWPIVLATIALGVGLGAHARVWLAGDLTAITAEELEAGELPKSGWLEISGRLVADENIMVAEGQKRKESYIPMVSRQWEPGQPVSVYIEFKEGRHASDVEVTMRGRVSWTGLPGMIREAYKRSDAPPAENYIVLEVGYDPEDSLAVARVALWIAGGLYVLAAVLFLLYWFAVRRAGSRWTD